MELGDLAGKVARVVDLVAIDLDDHVAGLDVLLGGRAVLGHLGDHGALGLRQADRVGDVVAHILDDDAEPAAIDGAMLLQLTDHLLDERCRHGEGDADIAAGGGEDRGVHADDLAVQIEGRAAGIAAIHRRVDLQIVIGARSDVAVMGRDDACGHRSAEAERIADREHPVTDARILFGKLHVRELLRGLDLEQSDVGPRVGADQRGRIFVAVLERHGDVLGILDHMVVGDEVPVRRNEEARALRERRVRTCRVAALAGLALAELLEEIVERVVLRQVGQPRNLQVVLGDLGVALDVDADDRRAHLLHEVGKAQRCGSIRSLHRLRRRNLGGLRRLG